MAPLRAWERLVVCDLDPGWVAQLAERHVGTFAAPSASPRATARVAIVDDVRSALTSGALGTAGAVGPRFATAAGSRGGRSG
jgi:hypothetical protein